MSIRRVVWNATKPRGAPSDGEIVPEFGCSALAAALLQSVCRLGIVMIADSGRCSGMVELRTRFSNLEFQWQKACADGIPWLRKSGIHRPASRFR